MKTTTIRIEHELYQRLKSLAEKRKVSLAALVNTALNDLCDDAAREALAAEARKSLNLDDPAAKARLRDVMRMKTGSSPKQHGSAPRNGQKSPDGMVFDADMGEWCSVRSDV